MDEKVRKEKLERFRTLKEKLKKFPGVIDVGVGFKEKDGELTKEVGFIVYVEEKKTENELPAEHIVPHEIDGVKTDVVKIKTTRNIVRPIRGGVKMDSEGSSGSGTLGCMATHPEHKTVLLTNHHVLYNQYYDTDSGVKRDIKVGQPGISCSWCCECNVIGLVKNSKRRKNDNVDCGIAKINKSDISHINEINGGKPIKGIAPLKADPVTGNMVPVFVGEKVKKTGATSNFTEGEVTKIGIPVNVKEEDGSHTPFVDQIEFIHKDGTSKKFADQGDSGSVVLNDDDKVVGLIMSARCEETPYDGQANNIHNVVSAMNITINVTEETGDGTGDVTSAKANYITTATDPEEENTIYQTYLENYKNLLNKSVVGKEILESLKTNAEEIRKLVNHNRSVMVAWQRNQGPAFIAAFLRKLKHDDETIVKEVNGISLISLLENMEAVLHVNGSEKLIKDINRFKGFLDTLNECQTFEDVINSITPVIDPSPSL
ncbi:MAG: trypsin-like serine protease [candidate division Zixibacteria bacterium]|nr:trypsin-like serine protease [candidate division Zixibacteria bacterium]